MLQTTLRGIKNAVDYSIGVDGADDLFEAKGRQLAPDVIVRELTGVPVHPPWSSVSGTILFRGPSGIILAMLPEKKTGTHY